MPDAVPGARSRSSSERSLLRLAIGVGFANYDTLYSLVWGQQLARGQTPAYGVPLAPTPHPLLELLGVILAPLGAAATLAIVVALAYLALAWLGYLVFLLGERWFSWPVGLAAAALVLSRYEVLSYGVRAYADIPYVALVLAALRDRDAAAARRLAGDRAARRRRAAAARRPGSSPASTGCTCGAASSPRERAAAGGAGRARAGAVGAVGPRGDRQRAVVADQHALDREAAAPHRPGILNVPYTARGGSARCSGPTGWSPARSAACWRCGWRARARCSARPSGVVAVVAFAIVAAAGLPIQDRYVFLIAAILVRLRRRRRCSAGARCRPSIRAGGCGRPRRS